MSEIQPYGDEPEEVWDDEEDDDAVDSLLLGGNAENETLDKEVSTYAEMLYHNLIVSLLSSNPKKEVVFASAWLCHFHFVVVYYSKIRPLSVRDLGC